MRVVRRAELNTAFFIFGESLVIFSAVILFRSFQDTAAASFDFTSVPYLNAAIFTFLCQCMLYLCGLYDPALKTGPFAQLIGLIQAFAIAFGVMLLLLVLIGRTIDFPSLFIGFSILIAFSKAWRLLLRKLSKTDYFRPKVILAGTEGRVQEIAPACQLTIVATADMQTPACTCSTQTKAPHHTLQNCHQLTELTERYKTAKVIIGKQVADSLTPNEICLLKHKGIQVCTEEEYLEILSGRRDPAALDPAGLIFSDSFQFNIRSIFKRMGDIVAASALLLCLSPLMLFISIKLKMKTPGQVLETRQYLGYRKKPFNRYQFVHPAEAPAGSLHNRFTQALPQLWNVLKGDMSLVGPCPIAPEQLETCKIPFIDERFTLRPGITGWAQTRCTCEGTAKSVEHMFAYDLFYLKHISMLLDTVIILSALSRQTLTAEARAAAIH